MPLPSNIVLWIKLNEEMEFRIDPKLAIQPSQRVNHVLCSISVNLITKLFVWIHTN